VLAELGFWLLVSVDELEAPSDAPLVLDPVELSEDPLEPVVLVELLGVLVSVELNPPEELDVGLLEADEPLRLPLPLVLPDPDVEPLWPEELPVLP
jgi:hypothetical protein